MISNKLISHLPLGRVDGEIDVFVLHISWIVRQLGTDRPSSYLLIGDTPTSDHPEHVAGTMRA